jgi:predicted AAA+ superfamily ATPase
MKREIISVWGTDGSEKTDLLESIYNELDSEKFTKSAWITVSPHFADQVLLIKDLVLKLNKEDTDGNLEEMRAAELTQELVRLLREQKYLIVLHGITSSTEWDSLVNILPEDEKCSSRIIVTTTNQSIADYCSGKRQNTYRLEGKDGVAVDPNEVHTTKT